MGLYCLCLFAQIISHILDAELDQTRLDCFEKLNEGICRALLPRFYYDKTDRKCKHFYYGGCGGNNNNFLTMEDCQNKCKNNEDKVLTKNNVADQNGNV